MKDAGLCCAPGGGGRRGTQEMIKRKKERERKRDTGKERTARIRKLSLIVCCIVHTILYLRTLYGFAGGRQ